MINIEKILEKYYKEDEPIILACSTGADSMFLLYKILETKYKKNIVACYFNHKTRPETDSEEVFLEQLGKENGFKVEVAECDFEKIKALHPSKSFEELAREKRYAFFDAIMNIYNSKYVITAHHLDDKIETFFFNMVRGTKLTGLVNMTESSGGILRPLLSLQKGEIESYLKTNSLKYNIDSSNKDIKISRNYLRHNVIPQFDKINKNYKKNLSNLINYIENVKDYIDYDIKQFLGENRFFVIKEYNKKDIFFKKELIRYIYYISNNKSTIGLSEANINEIIKFINGKNNKTIKEIRGLKMKKENTKILF